MERELFEAARKAMQHAHAPYSEFRVGAALRTVSGKIFAGCNVENASYPEGWCAETSAIAAMVTALPKAERRIKEVAVFAERRASVTPCGGCRQRLAEFGTPQTLIHLCDEDGPVSVLTLGELLPQAFGMKGVG
ncbi:cytidine deaminase [Afifella pfennigii]|uniref:cytidine deaminase n=1 Tax=Afifella pfennigii TaxID=209897 RepID=UPI00047AC294|nr:cytidine deaminase [Afifella pfennigii]